MAAVTAALTNGLAGIDPLALVAAWPSRYPVLLESAAESVQTGRHDLLPIADGNWFALGCDGRVRDQDGADLGADFAAVLDAHHADAGPDLNAGTAPFSGGWLLYLGYELISRFEPGLRLPDFTGADLPVALAIRTPAVCLRQRTDSAQGSGSASWTYLAERGAEALLDRLGDDLARLPRSVAAPSLPASEAVTEDDPRRFVEGVERILAYLRAGDVFQVNLSRAWRAQFAADIDPVTFYRQLRQRSPAPFAALLRWHGCAVASASPERLVRVRGRRIDTRPIAGTRPRGSTALRDAALRSELLANAKERAEHVMLIDLERNDLGRISRPGTVRVDELMVIESYSHVHHIVSNVSGELRPEVTPGAVLRAVFPGGTITGCPKIRCMEIIAELEQTGRGPYTGAIGYLNRNGDMDLNILIRSAWLHGRELGFRTGAGIVADSEPGRELAETRAKAAGLLSALGHGS